MSKIVQMGFKLNVPASEYRAIADSVAPAFASVAGLQWKIWFLNEAAGVAGGVYLFQDEATRDAFLASDLAGQVRSATFHEGLEVKLFDVMEEVTAVTRGPVLGVNVPAEAGSPSTR